MTARRRARRAAALVAASALALAGCTQTTQQAAQREPVTLKLGLLYTTAGRGGDLASTVLGAVGLATTKAEQQYGVTVETVEADYAGEVEDAPEAVEKLAAESDAILVATDDPAVVPAVRTADDVPVVHAFIGSESALTGRSNAFRVAPTDGMQAATIARFLTGHRGYKRIAVLTDTTPYGEQGATDLAAALAREGVAPVMQRRFTPGADIHGPIAEAAQKRAQALIVWVESPSEASRIVVEAHRTAQSYQLVLSGNLATFTFAKNASAQVTPVAFRDGMLSVGTWAGPWFRLARIIEFYEQFQIQNSALAPVQAAGVYDAVLALAAAARAGGTGAEDLIAGLESLTDFEGAGVPLTFAADDHEGVDEDDMAMLAFTKSQDSAGGDFAPEVDTGGGFFTIVSESLRLPEKYRFLQAM